MDFILASIINRLGSSTINPFTEMVCDLRLLVALWTTLGVLALRFDRRNGRRIALTVVIAIALHFVISEALLKHLLLAELPKRLRPYLAHPDAILPVGYRFTDSSFPSSHTASTTAMVTVFAHGYPRSLVAGVGFVLLMGFCRVHNGMHYPTDVLAGMLLGLGYGVLAIRAGVRWVPAPVALES